MVTRPADSESMDKWEVQLRKGCMELAVLAALWQGRLYGLEILRRLEQGAAVAMAEGTVYPLLARLKQDGLVDAEWEEANAGHPRKYYRLTAAGRRRAQAMAKSWARFSGGLDALLRPLTKE